MSGVNKVIIIGNIGKDIEIKYMPRGDAVANVLVITSEEWKDKQTGEKKERVEFHSLVFYRKLAEVVNNYLKKGSKIYIEGELRRREWEDKDGKKCYATDIIVKYMQMLDKKSDSDGSTSRAPPVSKQTPYNKDGVDQFNDDIPW